MQNINYIQPESLSCKNDSYCYIHDKSESYAIWERQKDNQFWIETGYSQIINPDFSNHYFGPDYIQAAIRSTNGEIIHGDVELHRINSNWYIHGHYADPKNNHVVLHVILHGESSPVYSNKLSVNPTIIMWHEKNQFWDSIRTHRIE